MFRRSRSGRRRTRRGRSVRSSFLRSRKPLFELLEDRRLMAVFTVTSTADAGAGTLRQAIIDANAMANVGGVNDEIRFNIAAAGVQTIQPTSALDAITEGVFINGYSEPGSSPGNFTGEINHTITIQLDGQSAGAGANGLQFISTANGSIVRGLVINRFLGSGIVINDADNVTIAGNFIGTDVAGTADLGNTFHGVLIINAANNNTVGGLTPQDRNLISGNNGDGVEIDGDGAVGNLIIGNLIGTDRFGTADLGNSVDGVHIMGSVSSTTIGGTGVLSTRNIISGNNDDGVGVSGAGVTGTLIRGNYIGTNVNGTAALGNSSDGVEIGNSAFNEVGDSVANAGNVISGNGDDGIDIFFPMSTNNIVQGNFIGTNFAGSGDLGNVDNGVEISNGANNNTVGGTTVGDANTIANNDKGVVVLDGTSIRNRIQRNSFRNNDNLGIDLGDNGVTANDAGDPDAGPNLIQNFPQFIGNATLLGDSIALRYLVDSTTGNQAYPLTIEFFVADSDNQEGRTFLAFDSYTGGSAQMEKQITIPAPAVLTNTRLVATATDANGNTSEFSAPVTISPPRFLGSEPTVILPNETIGQDEVDFYQYIAHSTGKLVVRTDFFHLFGDLRLEVRDEFGNLLAFSNSSTADQNFEEVILPVVAQQKYFISVIAVNFEDDQTNFYALEVENFPAPVPTGVHLDPASDTGMMNNDNVTSDTTPTFFIQTDVLEFVDTNGNGFAGAGEIHVLTAAEAAAGVTEGIAVEVTLVNTTTGTSITGFANPLILTIPEVYTFTSPELQPGVYLVSARTKIFDGQEDEAGMPDPAMGRSTASPPLWITISADSPTGGTFDLLASSDTGMFNDDNVTNKMSPAFSGQGPANSKVYVYAQAFNTAGAPVGGTLLVGNGVVGSDATDGIAGNGLGLWEVTVEPMADGKYNFFARFESAAGILGDAVAMTQIGAYTNPPVNIPDNNTPVDVPIVMNVPMNPTIVDVNVTVNITHPRVGDLDLILVAPDGTLIDLSLNNGGNGANYTGTIFDDAAGLSITAGVAPFTGTFRPQEVPGLSQLIGKQINGNWQLRIIDNTINEQVGQLLNWSLQFQTPLMVVIDTVEPNTPYLDLLDDTGRSNVDNITKDNTPMFSMTTTDPNVAFSQLLFTDNFKFRIYDRFQNGSQEVLIYDSAQDTTADNFMTPNDMFTALTQITRTMPFLTPASPAITAGGELSDGVHNLKLEVEDRAGNISHDFLLSITIDTAAPPVSFGLPTVASAIDGLAASSDTGVTTVPATFADRITSDTTPTLWGRAEANSIVRVYLDRDYDGIIDLNTDTFLGQTVAVPYDGNDAYPDGYWELTSALDLNQLFVNAGLEKDGLRRLLVTAEDVAGNPMPMLGVGGNPNAPGIATNVDELHIFIDTQGPQVTDVSINNLTSREYDLFDPKPSENGPTPLVDSITIHFRDLPSRVQALLAANSFLYPALVNNNGIAAVVGNYLLVGDHVGIIPIESVVVNNEVPADYTFNGTLTLVTSTSVIRDSNLVGAIEQPVVGDYILINNGAAAGQVRRIVAYNSALGQMTLDVPLLNLPIAGNSYTITTFAEATVVLDFYTPLPDDRYTLTVSDNLVDPANNKLDGESNADEPQEIPTFPSGDGVPGGSFVARFTLDSRPEIGSFVSQAINIDINGNFVWDPANAQIGNDATNVDLSFTMSAFEGGAAIPGDQSPHELLVAGRFTAIGTNSPGARFFDQMATYGNYNGVFRWLIDLDSDGVVYGNGDPDGVNDLIINQGTAAGFNSTARAGAIPVAGNFDRNANNGDEIGLYYSGTWFLDTNHDYILDRVFTGNLAGAPIVGDFDGNGFDDLAVFNSNQFFFDLTFNPLADTTANSNTSIVWGFPGVLDRPVAADMDQDGIDDIGLWVPRNSANPPRIVAEWYFLVSGTFSAATRIANYGTVNLLKHPFSPVPFGTDLYAEFGDELAMPIVGNFDPPVAASAVQSTLLAGDYDHNNRVDQADYAVWKSNFGSQTNLDADGNGDGVVNSADYSIWRNNLGAQAAGSGSGGGAGGSAGESVVENVVESVVENLVVSVEPIVFYAAEAPRIEFAEPAASTFDTVAPSQVEDLSLLLAVSHAPATSVDDALETYGAGGSADSDSDAASALDELALVAAWQSWDEL